MSELPSPTKQQKKQTRHRPNRKKHKTRPCPNSKKSNTPPPKQQKVKHATRPNSKKTKHASPPLKQQTQTCTLTWSALTFLLKLELRSGSMRKGRGFFFAVRAGEGGGRVLFFAVWAGACVAHAQTAKLKARPVQTGIIEHPKSPNNKKEQTTKNQTLLPHSCCSRWLCA